jgi:hypothetical protein
MKAKRTLLPLLISSAILATTAPASAINSAPSFGLASASADLRLRNTIGALTDMEGKEVRGKYNEYLGYILAVDERGKLAEMQIPTGVALPLPTDLLINKSDHVRAPTISRGDILAMIRKSGEHPLLEVKNERYRHL